MSVLTIALTSHEARADWLIRRRGAWHLPVQAACVGGVAASAILIGGGTVHRRVASVEST